MKRKRTEERKEFVDVVLQQLLSGVGSSAKNLTERYKRWKAGFSDHMYQFPSIKTLQLLVQEKRPGEIFLWSRQDRNRYIASLFKEDVEALKNGSYQSIIVNLEQKSPSLAQHMNEIFEDHKEKYLFVQEVRAYLKKHTDPKSLELEKYFNGYKNQLKNGKLYSQEIETETSRKIVTLSCQRGGRLMKLATPGSNYDIAILHGMDVTKKIELKQCAKAQKYYNQFKMAFHHPFKHTECAGIFCFQFISSEFNLTTFAVLVVDRIATLHTAVGKRNTWNVYLPVLEWGDGRKITSFQANDIFYEVLAKMEETSYKFCTGNTALEDAVRWLQELSDDENQTLLHEAQSDSANINKGNEGEKNVRVCIHSVYGENALKQETQLVTGDKVDLCYRINETNYNFSSKTVRKQNPNSFQFPMTHMVNGKRNTPFTIDSACDVLCASASGAILDGLIKKFGMVNVNANKALFVFSKHKIVRGKSSHTITESCWRDHCILMMENTPCDPLKSKVVFDTAIYSI